MSEICIKCGVLILEPNKYYGKYKCKGCIAKYHRKWISEHPEARKKKNEGLKEYRKNNKGKIIVHQKSIPKCNSCKVILTELNSYYPKSTTSLTCKGCYKVYHAKYKEKFLKTDKGRKSWNKASKKARALYPEKWKARYLFRYAVKTGCISKKPCEVCGSEKSEGHHEDYSKPLDVRWLCRKHHTELHIEQRNKQKLLVSTPSQSQGEIEK